MFLSGVKLLEFEECEGAREKGCECYPKSRLCESNRARARAARWPRRAARWLPWRNEPIGTEVNLAFTLEHNLVELQTVRLDNRPGRFLLGTAAPRTVIDPRFAGSGRTSLQLARRRPSASAPPPLDLSGVADAIIGVEAWGNRADLHRLPQRPGDVSEGRHPPRHMTIFSYDAEPMIYVNVDGRDDRRHRRHLQPRHPRAPRHAPGRGNARRARSPTPTSARSTCSYANIARARIGNRLLSRFLVTIDYGKRLVGLWRDPRTPRSRQDTYGAASVRLNSRLAHVRLHAPPSARPGAPRSARATSPRAA